MLYLPLKAVCGQEALLQAMKTVCGFNTDNFHNLFLTRKLNGREEPLEGVDLLLSKSSYNFHS